MHDLAYREKVVNQLAILVPIVSESHFFVPKYLEDLPGSMAALEFASRGMSSEVYPSLLGVAS
jgi:hypothetical protein